MRKWKDQQWLQNWTIPPCSVSVERMVGCVCKRQNGRIKREERRHTHTHTHTETLREGPQGQVLTCIWRRAFADGEDGAEVLLLLGQALLQALQLPEALTALVLHGAHMLDQVELGLGRVATQHTMVIAGITLHRVFVLLQVLWEGKVRERPRARERKKGGQIKRKRKREKKRLL